MNKNKKVATDEMLKKMKHLILSTNLGKRELAKEMGFAYSTAQRMCMDNKEFRDLWVGIKYYRITRDMGVDHESSDDKAAMG